MNISIRMIGADKESARFEAVVADAKGRAKEYVVSVGDKFWRSVTRGRFSPAELVARSMKFITRQPPDPTRKRFSENIDLSDIAALFPNYTSKMRMG
jgi:hypothetical protein